MKHRISHAECVKLRLALVQMSAHGVTGGLVSKALVLLDKPKLELVVYVVHKHEDVPINVHGEIGNHVPAVVYALQVKQSLLNAALM